MNLFCCEARKLIGARLILVLIACLLAASGVVCFLGCRDDGISRFGIGAADEVRSFAEYYADRPEEYSEFARESLKQSSEKILALMKKWSDDYEAGFATKNDYPDLIKHPEYAYVYTYSTFVPDGVLINYFDRITETKRDFEYGVKGILDRADKIAGELRRDKGLGVGDKLYDYQAYVYTEYRDLQSSVKIGGAVFGWDKLLTFSYGDIFLFAALILFASTVFVPEKERGVLPLNRSTKRGRLPLYAAKTAFLAAGSALLALLFALIPFVIVFLTHGLSSPFADVQNVKGFVYYCEHQSILGYYLYSLLLKVLASVGFSAIAGFVAALTYNAAAGLLIPAAVFGVNFYMSKLSGGLHPAMHTLNLLSVAGGYTLGERLYFWQIFGGCVKFTLLAPLIAALAALTFSGGILILSSYGFRRAGLLRLPRLLPAVKNALHKAEETLRKALPRRKSITAPMAVWEMRKQFFWRVSAMLLAALLLIAQTAITVRDRVNFAHSREYKIYTTFFLPYTEGPVSESGAVYKLMIDAYSDPDNGRELLLDARNGGVIGSEYYGRLKADLELIEKYGFSSDLGTSRLIYEEMTVRENTGKAPWFIDYSDVSHLLTRGTCYTLYAAILLVCTLSFAVEYDGKNRLNSFSVILKTTKNGRKKTFFNKILSSALLSLGLAFVFYGVQALILLPGTNLSVLKAPLCSLPAFSDCKGGLTVGGYLAFKAVFLPVAAVLLGLFCAAVSALIRNTFASLAISSGCTLVPMLLYKLGNEKAGFLSFGSFFGVQELAQLSMKRQLFSANFGAFILFACCFAAVTAALLLTARRKFVK